jgi:hypothetical protein
MQESNIPGGGTTSRDNNIDSHRGRNFTIPQPIAEEEQQLPQLESAVGETDTKESPAAAFIDSVKKFFAPCVGAVEDASLYIGECRPSHLNSCETNEQGENIAEDVIMRLRERNGGFRQSMKRRSETLEIPSHGMLFDDDDVSAISSHTLEEMERLRMAQNSRLSNFHMSPSNNYNNSESSATNIMRPKPGDLLVPQKVGTCEQAWNTKNSSATNETAESTNELAICVSASDSSSSQGNEQPKEDVPRATSSAPSWGRKAEKDEGLKTHRVG